MNGETGRIGARQVGYRRRRLEALELLKNGGVQAMFVYVFVAILILVLQVRINCTINFVEPGEVQHEAKKKSRLATLPPPQNISTTLWGWGFASGKLKTHLVRPSTG